MAGTVADHYNQQETGKCRTYRLDYRKEIEIMNKEQKCRLLEEKLKNLKVHKRMIREYADE